MPFQVYLLFAHLPDSSLPAVSAVSKGCTDQGPQCNVWHSVGASLNEAINVCSAETGAQPPGCMHHCSMLCGCATTVHTIRTGNLIMWGGIAQVICWGGT